MFASFFRLLVCVAPAFVASTAAAQERQPVDLELVLAVDVSVSMNRQELEIQRAGYAAALKDADVLRAIQSGPHGRIAVTYFEWAGVTSQQLIVPWTVVGSAEDAASVAERLNRLPAWQPRRTSISGALDYGIALLADSPFESDRRVIDVSGDGTNNEGRPVVAARDAAGAQDVTVNGLPVMADLDTFSTNDVARLDDYYEHCVTGGPGSFVIAVGDWTEFPAAIRRKFLMEIARRPAPPRSRPPVILAQASPAYDCLVGERNYKDSPLRNKNNPERFQFPNNLPENWRNWKQ
jgi:hypothetical protein